MTSTTSSTPSSREFQPGDRVVCIDADKSADRLTLGKTYTVEHIAPSFSGRIRLALLGVSSYGGFMPERFRLATPTLYKRPLC